MKKILTLLMILSMSKSFSQTTTLVLRPGPDQSKDAEIWSLSPTTSLGNWPELKQNAWTWGGVIGFERGLIQFDLTQIPVGATVLSASLSFYAIDSPSTQYDYHDPKKSNAVWIKRITTDWDAVTVTWGNRPSATDDNEVEIPSSTIGFEYYLNIDVTQMVKDMLNDPSGSFGFMLKLRKEKTYRRMTFASSDCGDPSRYPSLTITYTTGDSKNNQLLQANSNVYPNPFTDRITISSSLLNAGSVIAIYDLSGRLVYSTKGVSDLNGNIELSLKSLPPQTYLLQIISASRQQQFKIVKN